MGVEGSYEKVMYCTTCHEELSREKIVIPALKEPDTEEPGTETPAPEPDTEEPGNRDTGAGHRETGAQTQLCVEKNDRGNLHERGRKNLFLCMWGQLYRKNCKEVPYTGEKTDTCKTGQQWKECDHVQLVQNSMKQVKINAPKTVKLSEDHYSYDGKAKKPAIK